MKKVLAMFAIAVSLVACNDDATTTTVSDSTTMTSTDSLNQVPPPPAPSMDTTNMMDTVNKMTADSTKK